MNFDETVKLFERLGYRVELSKHPYLFAIVKDSNLRIGFCEPNGKSYSYIDGKIAIDREDCFDKWSKCPIDLSFPKNGKQIQFLIDKINWLKTDEGYKASNGYDFDNWVKEYPE